jgi:hypothetical protein
MECVSDSDNHSKMIAEIADMSDLIYDGKFCEAIELILKFESTFHRLESFEASFLLSKIGRGFSNSRILTLLFSRGGRMTKQFMDICLRDTLIYKNGFTRRLARWIASHFMPDQIEDAVNWFDPRTEICISSQTKYELNCMFSSRSLLSDIIHDYSEFRPNPDACADESSFRVVSDLCFALRKKEYLIKMAEKDKLMKM